MSEITEITKKIVSCIEITEDGQYDEYNTGFINGLTLAKSIVDDKTPCFRKVEHQNGWHKIESESDLPKTAGFYLVTIKPLIDKSYVGLTRYTTNGLRHSFGVPSDCKVLAWRELPEPYEVKE